jgi:transcriptional regulator with XRE-family HTH domain
LSKARPNQNTEFGERLKQLREGRSLNTAELARRIHASPAAIWHWEHRGTVPRSDTISTIAQVLGVSRSFLETGKMIDGGSEVGSTPSTADQMSLEQLMRAIEAKGFDVYVRSKSDGRS